MINNKKDLLLKIVLIFALALSHKALMIIMGLPHISFLQHIFTIFSIILILLLFSAFNNKIQNKNFKSVVENSIAPAYIIQDGKIIYCNEALGNLLGYSRGEVIGKDFKMFVYNQDIIKVEKNIESKLKGKKPKSYELRVIKKSGETTYVEVHGSVIMYNGYSSVGGILLDSTEKRRVLRELDKTQQEFKSLFENNPDAVFSVDRGGRFTRMNQKCELILKMNKEYFLNKHFTELLPTYEIPRMEKIFKSVIMSGRSETFDTEMLVNSELVFLRCTSIPIIVNNSVVGVHGVVQDITNEKAMTEKMKYMAYHDYLTGLPNRALFREKLKEKILFRKDNVGLMFLDLDGFKEINDKYGHSTGDEVLKIISNRLTNVLFKNDIVCRLAGDEFTIIIDELDDTSFECLSFIADKIVEEIKKPIEIDNNIVSVTTSLGVSLYKENLSIDDFIKQADFAMYEAKRLGKNKYCFYGL